MSSMQAHTLLSHPIDAVYRIDRELGVGSFGTVNLGYSKTQNQIFAVKTLKDTSGINPYHLREVQFFENVGKHPNIIGLQEMFVDPDSMLVHFVLEYMDLTLLTFMRRQRGRNLPIGVTLSIAKQLIRGIHFIHKNHFVHRDLKPENILVCYRPSSQDPSRSKLTIKLADFGLSRRQDMPGDLTDWSGYVATRWYRAPEQLLRMRNHGPGLDIWAFGLLLYEVICLTPLFRGDTTSTMIKLQKLILGVPSPTAYGGSWAAAPEPLLRDGAKGTNGTDLRLHVSLAEEEPLMTLVHYCLQWDPNMRMSTNEIFGSLLKIQEQVQRRMNDLAPRDITNVTEHRLRPHTTGK